jgi:hypothetical protein
MGGGLVAGGDTGLDAESSSIPSLDDDRVMLRMKSRASGSIAFGVGVNVSVDGGGMPFVGQSSGVHTPCEVGWLAPAVLQVLPMLASNLGLVWRCLV